MKKIRRTRITVRKREIVVVKSNEKNSFFENMEPEVCPLCHSPLHSKSIAPVRCDERLLTESEDLLTEKTNE